MATVALEERPRDVDVAAGARRDPLLVVEEGEAAFEVDHHRSGPGGAAVAGNGHRDAARGAMREAQVVDERRVVERAVRSKCQDRITAGLHVFEQTGTSRGWIPTRQDDIRERVAAISAEVDVSAESKAIVVCRRNNVLAVGRVDDYVLLVLRVIALCSVH